MSELSMRGPHPVGVVSHELADPGRGGRRIALEIWYPADPSHRGQDLTAATQDEYSLFGGFSVRQEAVRDARPLAGAHPGVLFSHGFAGHRRQSTFLCTHLASHGYLVAAPDHAGNTMTDMMMLALSLGPSQMPSDPEALLGGYVFDRPRDMSLCLDALAGGELAGRVGELTLSCGVGVTGHSFGGYTSLLLARRDPRVRAVVPIAPAGGPGPLWALALERELDFAFPQGVETLYLSAERDTLLPLAGIEQLFRRTPEPARMLVLERADHMHFCDRVERSHEFFRSMPQVGPFAAIARSLPPMSELVPGFQGHDFTNLCTQMHFDAVLRGSEQARDFWRADPVQALAQRGIAARELTREHRA
jgi:dienelactone hydrolase